MGAKHTIPTFMGDWDQEKQRGVCLDFPERDFQTLKKYLFILGSKKERSSVNLYKINRSFKIKTFSMRSQGQSKNKTWDILEELAQPCEAFYKTA